MAKRLGSIIQQSFLYAIYFAPRGRNRLLVLGEQLAQRHLNYDDKLIGIIGDAGSGKSSIIKGMFPGLELVNHDDGLTSGKIMQMKLDYGGKNYDSTTYHIDMRFQMAFTQMFEIVEFVKGALENGRRVIIEHFELLFPYLKINASILVGVGEQIIVVRPTIFGPLPQDVHSYVFDSLVYRKMAHTAEDLTRVIMEREYAMEDRAYSGDIRRGFILQFSERPYVDLYDLERKVNALIEQNAPVSYLDEDHIKVGDTIIACNGPRIHLRSTGEIKNYKLVKEIMYDKINDVYSIVGLISGDEEQLEDINRLSFL